MDSGCGKKRTHAENIKQKKRPGKGLSLIEGFLARMARMPNGSLGAGRDAPLSTVD